MSSRTKGVFLSLLLLSASMNACASSEKTGITQRGATGPLHLRLWLSNGETIELSSLRGTKTLIFVFATFDGVSQAAASTLAFFTKRHPEIYVIGIASQPNAKVFVDAWAHALTPPYHVGYAPGRDLQTGQTPLGVIDRVPMFILIDAQGYERNRVFGFQTEAHLEKLID